MGLFNLLSDRLKVLLIHSEVEECQLFLACIQDTNDHFFPAGGGQDGNPQIHLVFFDFHLNASVLGQSSFGDV